MRKVFDRHMKQAPFKRKFSRMVDAPVDPLECLSTTPQETPGSPGLVRRPRSVRMTFLTSLTVAFDFRKRGCHVKAFSVFRARDFWPPPPFNQPHFNVFLLGVIVPKRGASAGPPYNGQCCKAYELPCVRAIDVPGCVNEPWKLLKTAIPPPCSLSCVKNKFWYGEAEASPYQSQLDGGWKPSYGLQVPDYK
jgi:hypothetical protein